MQPPSLAAALQGRYTIERELGRGGMATVYLARDEKHQRLVALKVLDPELGAVLGAERFLSEIRVTANLQHPNLLPLFDSGEADGLLYYVMPFVDGETLRARLDREKQLPVDEATRIAVAIANALAYAHGHGVIHRDLKPENVLFQAGQPIVADFGIALAVSNAGGTRVTQTGLSLGTPQYMSPEQATGDRTIDGRTDIYALGAVTYEMLSGEPPHTGTTAQAIIARLMTTEPEPLTVLRKAVPPHIAAAVHKAIEKLPADRFENAKDFAAALTNPASVTAGPTTVRARTLGSNRRLTVVLAVACGVAIAVGAWGWLRGAPERPPLSTRFVIDMPKGIGLSNVYAPLTITHDGRTIIFRGVVADSQVMLVRRDIDNLDAVPIAGTATAARAAVSPDDKWVAFQRASGDVARVSLAGSPPLRVDTGLAGLSWVSNDEMIVAEPGLRLLSTTGAKGKTILNPDPKRNEILLRWPHVLSDGKTVLYVSWPAAGLADARIGVVSLATGQSKVLDLLGTTPLGVADGQLFYVSATAVISAVPFDVKALQITGAPRALIEGVNMNTTVGAARAALADSGTLVYIAGGSITHLVSVDLNGTSRTLFTDEDVNAPVWSPDGKRIAVQLGSPRGKLDIGIYDVATGRVDRLPGSGSNRSPSWSPDSKRVAYVSDRGGAQAVWWQPIDGSGVAEKLADLGVSEADAMLSPDGKSVIFRSQISNDLGATLPGATEPELAEISLAGDRKPRTIVKDRTAAHPAVSPDGKWFAYSSAKSGKLEVYVRPFHGDGADIQVSLDGGNDPMWSADGRTLYYLVGSRRFWAATVEPGPAFRVTGRRLLLESPLFGAGASTRPPFAISPDGKRLVGLSRVDADAKIVVITNWLAELRWSKR